MRETEPKILGFLCNWCAYAGADLTGVSRIQYVSNIRIVRVMCSGRLDTDFIFTSFLNNIDGIFVGACHIGDCHYISGNIQTDVKIKWVKRMLSMLSIDPRRVVLEYISASEGEKFAKAVNNFTSLIKQLPPIQLTHTQIENLKAMRDVCRDFRIRWLLGKEYEIVTKGNVYNEKISPEDWDKFINDVLRDRYIQYRIFQLADAPVSAVELSQKLHLSPHLIMRHTIDLRVRGILRQIKSDDYIQYIRGG